MEDFSVVKAFFIVLIVFMVMFIGANLAGEWVYQEDSFEAVVVEIEPYGSGGLFGGSQVVIKFDDGRVYNLYSIPDGLRINNSYSMEYRKPYFIRSPYLVIVKTGDS